MEQLQSCSFPTTVFMAARHRSPGRDTPQEAARCPSLPAPHLASSRPLHEKGETQTGSKARDSDGLHHQDPEFPGAATPQSTTPCT